jgi:general secretion pathway protein D
MRFAFLLIILCINLSAFEETKKVSNDLRKELLTKYREAADLRKKNAGELEFKQLLSEINKIKQKILETDKAFINENTEMKDETGFWDQGETTLATLIVEYGSGDYLYIIPPELSNMKLQLFSMIPIPRAVWDEMLEFILAQNGIGVRKINNFSKQLFVLKHDPSTIEAITDNYEDLLLIEDHKRVLFVISPPFEKIKSTQNFFERFSDPKITTVQTIGSKIAVISQKKNLAKLINIYKTIWESDQEKVIKICQLSKLPIDEAEKILKTFFNAGDSKARTVIYKNITDELHVLSIKNALVLIGEASTVNRAESVLNDLENQLQDPKEMTVYWYQCKNTDPFDLARLLDQVYDSLSTNIHHINSKKQFENKHTNANHDNSSKTSFGNFIVDIKTSSIMMVVKRNDINKIQSILKKLDVPKRMVEIEVLLVEKKIQDQKKSGINLLKLGSQQLDKSFSINFDTDPRSKRKGILDFILQMPKSKIPAFDLTFSLLMAQENVSLHANPTITAMNQTPATLSIVEEISINNGAVQMDSNNKLALEKSFTRAQYGTTITMTPMIHFPEDEEENERGFVTLSTNITFETTQMSQDDRPPVTRRHIENEVRIPDKETIVIGGLRRKSTEVSQEKIPFLGDIPGLGKLFGTTKTSESNTEMFIFITPKILKDPSVERKNLRQAKLKLRPGDSEDILLKIKDAKIFERSYALRDGIHLLFDHFN